MARTRKVDAKALAKKLIEKQLILFEANPNTKLLPSELSWLLDVFKTMAEAEAKEVPNPLEDLDESELELIINDGKQSRTSSGS